MTDKRHILSDDRIVSTLLAALRLYQSILEAGQIPLEIAMIAGDCNGRPPLDSDEIEVLCEEINL